MHVLDVGRLDRCFFFVDALLGWQAEADDGCEPLFFQIRHAGRIRSAAAREYRIDLVEVLDALNVDFLDLRSDWNDECRDGQRRGEVVTNHGQSPLARDSTLLSLPSRV